MTVMTVGDLFIDALRIEVNLASPTNRSHGHRILDAPCDCQTPRVMCHKSRQQLMDESQMVVDDTTITSHIKRIRKKFIIIDTPI